MAASVAPALAMAVAAILAVLMRTLAVQLRLTAQQTRGNERPGCVIRPSTTAGRACGLSLRPASCPPARKARDAAACRAIAAVLPQSAWAHGDYRVEAARLAGSVPSGTIWSRQSLRRSGSEDPWVVAFTALGVEYEAIRAHLAGPVRQHEERGTLYEVGALSGARGSWRVALVQTGPGSTTAGVQLERAIPVFAPQVVLFLGVAGGRKDVAIGDVVVADVIYDYEWGKSTLQGYLPRMRTRFPAHRLLQRAQLVARQNRWQQRIRPGCPQPAPTAFVKPIVTGAKVVADTRSDVARLLDHYASDALAVETEGHGFLEGAYANPEVDALVIRGISDLLTGKDKADDDNWQPVASRHAAAFAVELLDTIGASHATQAAKPHRPPYRNALPHQAIRPSCKPRVHD